MKFVLQVVFYISILFFLLPNSITAQRVLGLPQIFERPRDLFPRPGDGNDGDYDTPRDDKAYLREIENTSNKSRTKPWVVISDRDNNPVYRNPSKNGDIVEEVSFRESFLVVDEKDTWLKIGRGTANSRLRSSDLQIVGWVPKTDMLLWTSGLVSYRTKINRKVFLLNRSDNIKRLLGDVEKRKQLYAEIYRSPNATGKEPDKSIYEHYFVYKIENNMYLIGTDDKFNSINIGNTLIGWVNYRKLNDWSTRISLEPNFDPEAFAERKNNEKLRLKGFDTPQGVENFVLSGNKKGMIWDSDPVIVLDKYMSEKNPRRLKVDNVRFPLFSKDNSGNTPIFHSGVIGSIKILVDENGKLKYESEITEQDFGNIRTITKELNYKNNNVNIFFVIEGTDKTYSFKQDIIQAINDLSQQKALRTIPNVKYGALIYRDIPEGESRITEHIRLSTSLTRVTDFINQASFENQIDQDDYTALFYGLNKSIKVAGFNDKELNIIVTIGSNGDFKANKVRRASASVEYMPDASSVAKNLDDLDAHIHSIQLYNDGRRYTGVAYGIYSQRLILAAAQNRYNKNLDNRLATEVPKKNDKLVFLEPTMEQPVGMTSSKVSSGRPGGIILPLNGQSLSANRITAGLEELVLESINYEKAIAQVFNDLLSSPKSLRELSFDNSISASAFTSGIIDVLVKKNKDVSATQLTKALDTKLMLFTEFYLPVKLPNTNHPTCKYVLFMPEADLLDYNRMMERNISQINDSSYPEKRKSLKAIYSNLVKTFAANNYLDGRKIEDIPISEVNALMQGVQGEGLNLNPEQKNNQILLGQIEEEKQVSNQQVDELIKQFYDVNMELTRILRLRDNYEFCYISDNGNRYYWLLPSQVF